MLSEREQTIISLKVFGGLQHEQISEVLELKSLGRVLNRTELSGPNRHLRRHELPTESRTRRTSCCEHDLHLRPKPELASRQSRGRRTTGILHGPCVLTA